jgi:hypothetical protein
LLDDAAVLHAAATSALHTESNIKRPALDDLTDIEHGGLAAQFFLRDKAEGEPEPPTNTPAKLDHAAGTNALPPNGGKPISGIWTGFLEAPTTDVFNIRVDTDAGATVTLTLDGTTIAPDQLLAVGIPDTVAEFRGHGRHCASLQRLVIITARQMTLKARHHDWVVKP